MAATQKQFSIGGMTCVNCQNRIEQTLSRTVGITAASADYDTGCASVDYDPDVISWDEIVSIIGGLDYEVLPDGAPKAQEFTRVVSLMVIIVSLYVLLQRFGLLTLLVPDRLAESGMGYGMLFVTGLITSVHCIAMCGGINLSQCIPAPAGAESGGRLSAYVPAALYNLGRVVSYTVVGFILGGVGYLAGGGSQVGIPVLVQGILKLIAGLLMVVMGINMLGLFPALRRFTVRMPKIFAARIGREKARSTRPFVIGLLNGLMPCGPLQSMQIVALASGNPFTGALSMLLFSLGTAPLMLGLGTVVSALGKKFAQSVMNVGAVLVVVLGLAMLSQGGSLSGLLLPDRLLPVILALAAVGVAASIPFSKASHRIAGVLACLAIVTAAGFGWHYVSEGRDADHAAEAQLVDGTQLVYSTLSSGQYPSIRVREGIPVKWTITAPEGSVNGCNYKMIIQDYGIEHEFAVGENIVEFTPPAAGTVSYSCWMGMIHGDIFVTP